MKFKTFLFASMVIVTGLMVPVLLAAESQEKEKTAADPGQVARGAYLVNFGGCSDCHTPKNMTPQGPVLNMDKLLSGHPSDWKVPEFPKSVMGPDAWGAVASADLTAWAGPWGISFPANLTPDMETGLGSWTEDMFRETMRTGKHLGVGRDLLPPMPWQSVSALTDDDLKALFAYLKSLKPVHNAVPDPIPPAH